MHSHSQSLCIVSYAEKIPLLMKAFLQTTDDGESQDGMNNLLTMVPEEACDEEDKKRILQGCLSYRLLKKAILQHSYFLSRGNTYKVHNDQCTLCRKEENAKGIASSFEHKGHSIPRPNVMFFF